jgi:hypothetical protein
MYMYRQNIILEFPLPALGDAKMKIEQKGELIKKEHRETGAVATVIYVRYLLATGLLLCAVVLLLFIVSYGSLSAANYWLSIWSSAGTLFLEHQRHNASTDPGAIGTTGAGNTSLGALVGGPAYSLGRENNTTPAPVTVRERQISCLDRGKFDIIMIMRVRTTTGAGNTSFSALRFSVGGSAYSLGKENITRPC